VGYLVGVYRIATGPGAELKPAHELQVDMLDSSANNVGPWPVALGCTCSMVLDTTYFCAALIVWAKGFIQSGLAPVGAGGRHADSIIS
jgi:hypothetical protein